MVKLIFTIYLTVYTFSGPDHIKKKSVRLALHIRQPYLANSCYSISSLVSVLATKDGYKGSIESLQESR
jgi:hypothetical protein